MRILLLLMAFSFATVSAQPEIGGKKSIAVPKSNSTLPPPSASSSSSSSMFNLPEPKPSRTLDTSPMSSFGKPQQFDNPNAEVEKNINKKNYQIWDVDPKRNQYLGEIKTKSKVGRIVYRDYDAIDGDVIRIYIDGQLTANSIGLSGDFEGFDITFKEGTNKIEFESLSEGFSPPNTAEIVVYDEQGNVLFQNGWAIANGYRASVDIIKD